MLADPTSLQATKLGLQPAADAGELGIPYLHLGTVVRRTVIASRPDLVRRYLLAYQAGLERFFTDAAMSQQVLAKYTQQDDPEVLAGTYRAYADRYVSRDVRPRPETLVPILAAMSNPRAQEVAPESLVDERPVRQLQAGGLLVGR
jgi:ABC-type nitrate/sulfonate/bicarbonate transport system substrate-binding protein